MVRPTSFLSLRGLMLASLLFPSVALAQERGFKRVHDSDGAATYAGYAEKYALIVGVNEYSDEQLPDLRYAVSDAAAVRDILVETYRYPEENVTMLLDEDATGDNIKAALGRYLQSDIDEDSQLLVYFAGHGTTIGGQDTGQLGFLLPTNAKVGDFSSTFSTGLPMNDIQNLARAARPKHVLFLMDACYGGLAQTRSQMSSAFIQSALARKARQLITAGSADEEVIESAEWQHSAFTKVLIDALEEGLADSNLDGIITSMELFVYIQNRVPYWAQSQGGQQTPQFARLTPDDGTFLFINDDAALAALGSGDVGPQGLDEEAIARSFETPVQIRADVSNARVYIDGEEVGWLSEGVLDHSAAPGFYRIEVSKEKYQSDPQEVEIKPDTTMTVSFHMEPMFTVVDFSVEPHDAAVYVDGDFVGSGSFQEEIMRGRHEVAISKDGYRPYRESINVVQDSLRFHRVLDEIQMLLEIYSAPLGARVQLRGDSIGVTPHSVPLGYGTHRFLLSLDGHKDALLEVDVEESGTQRELVRMREATEVIARRTYRRELTGHAFGALLSGALAAGAYVGHRILADEYDRTPEDDGNKQLYGITRWVALGVSGTLVIHSLINVAGLITTDYNEILEKQVEVELNETSTLAFGYSLSNRSLGVSLTF